MRDGVRLTFLYQPNREEAEMSRKVLLVFAFFLVFSVLVFGFAFAEKSTVRKSELLKPIDSTPENYISQYLLKSPTGYVPSSFRPTADAIVGTTWYEPQQPCSMPKMIANDYQGGINGQHFCWTEWPAEPPVSRYVNYRYNDTGGSWQNKVAVDSVSTGFAGLDIFLDSHIAVIYHTTAAKYPEPSPRRTMIAIDTSATPGAGEFVLYDIPDSTETMEEAGMWPHGGIDSCGNIHVLALEGIIAHGTYPIGYVRCTPEGNLLRCEGPGRGPYYITADQFCQPGSLVSYLDHTSCESYIVTTDPHSKKVALVWTKWTENWPVSDDTSQCQIAQDVWYIESDSCGNDWIHADTFGDFTYTNITRWKSNDPYRTYCDLAGVYDLDHNLHIFWNAHYLREAIGKYDPYDVKLMHWSPNIELVCPGDDTVRYTVVATRKSDGTHTNPWAWNRLISKMSVGIGIPGSEKQGWLFCVWQQFDDDDLSASGYSNGELYFSFSTNLGLTWHTPKNLTQTPSPGCPAGNCDSEAWPSLATRVDSFMHIQYILDRDAGVVDEEQGVIYTENYVMYKKEKVDTLTVSAVARIDWAPKEFWLAVENGGTTVETFWIRNIGTTTLMGNLIETADWLDLRPTSFSLPEGACPKFIEVTIDAFTYAETLLVDTIRIMSNDEGGNDSVYIPVKVMVSDQSFLTDTLVVAAYSPVDLIIIDPIGASIGIDFNTIPDATYDTTQDLNDDGDLDDLVTMPNRLVGDYLIEVVAEPADTGEYDLGVRIDGSDMVLLADNQPSPSPDEPDTFIYNSVEYLKGDANGDWKINLSDVIYLANYLLKGGPEPQPLESGDVNCDDKINLGDVIYLANYLLKGGPPPCN